MKKYFINPDNKQYKANLHCHSNLSDGELTPEELKEAYKGKGYSILAITDHERPCNHSDLSQEDFLLITGYEAYIRPSKICRHNIFAPEIHLNLFAKEAENEKCICFNEASCKYVKNPIERLKMKKVGSKKIREYTTEYINAFTKTAVDNGYLVSYNHPVWSMESDERILSYENIFSLEIDNYSSWKINRIEGNSLLYDKILLNKKGWFCHGGDDNHNHGDINNPLSSDSFGAFTMIMAENLNYDSVISAMENGEIYSSTGPVIKEISIENGMVHIACSDACCILLYNGSKAVKRMDSLSCDLTEADLPLHEKSEYFRVSVIDGNGKTASSRGFLRNEWEEYLNV